MVKPGYKSVTITHDVYNKINRIMERENETAGYKKYRSVAHFVEEQIMAYHLPESTPLEHFNFSEQGVKILDRNLKTKRSRGKIIDVYFKPNKIWCEEDQSSTCAHCVFALTLPEVQQLIYKKGWKIEIK